MAKFVRLPIYDENGVELKEYLQIDIAAVFFNVGSAKVIRKEED